MYFLIIILVDLLILFLLYKSMPPGTGKVVMYTGGVKSGKTTIAVWAALFCYYSVLCGWWIYTYITRFVLYPLYCIFTRFRLLRARPRPLLYSNIPLRNVRYVSVTRDILLRKQKVVARSVMLLSEASLIADSMLYQDKDINEQLMLFNKLWAHESHGGVLIYDTQSISDNHFAVKRCLNSYIYIHKSIILPFFVLYRYRTERNAENTVNAYVSDVGNELKWCLVPKRVWKRFDCYCYSAFTDDLPSADTIEVRRGKSADLKARKIPSFRKWRDKNIGGDDNAV